jgi:protein regulator of cytokinesis 1
MCVGWGLILDSWQNERLHRVSEYVNVVYELCTVLGIDSIQILADVHPSLVSSTPGQTKNISNGTIEGLAQTIHSLREEKRVRLLKVRVNPVFCCCTKD